MVCKLAPGRIPFSKNFSLVQPIEMHNGTRGSNGNFPEQTDDLRRCSTSSVPTGWNGNYRCICIIFPFLLLANLLALTPKFVADKTDGLL